jgi:hypothetical protein
VRRAAGAALLGLVLGAGAAGIARAQDAPPAFDDLLAEAGLTRADLVVAGPGGAPPDGLGHLIGDGIPFLPPVVSALHRDPLSLPPLGVDLLAVAEAVAAAETPTLEPLVTAFTLHPRLPAFRGGAVPPVALDAIGPGVWTAVLAAVRDRSRFDPHAPVFHLRPWPAGMRPAGMGVGPVSAGERALPEPLRQPLAELLAAVGRAGEAVERSWRGVDRETVARAVATPDVARLLPGAAVTWPALAEIARRDTPGRPGSGPAGERGAALRDLTVALERAVADLAAAAKTVPPESRERFAGRSWSTPWGRVIVGSFGPDEHRCAGDCLLIVDPGGDDRYTGSAAAAVFPRQPVAVVMDLSGDDRYDAAEGPAQGAGLGGLGVLVDVTGADEYRAGDRAQGFGLLGSGVLWDLAGDDRYNAGGGAQGAALFGGGLLADAAGADTYRALGEAQGFGGSGGAAALVDLAGNDDYVAEPDPSRAPGRADYHADHRVAASNAQGAGVGRRGDRTDGDAWAGGVGVLLDRAGDDTYTAGTFAQGVGYWWGLGLLLDGGGADAYRSAYFAQGSAAHFALGLLYDRDGDDRYVLDSPADLAAGFGSGAGLGYGWDHAVGMLLDETGNDLYEADKTALGVAHRRSFALFADGAGNDRYRLSAGRGVASSLGRVDDNPGGLEPGPGAKSPWRAAGRSPQAGLFVDLGGKDAYPEDETRELGDGGRWVVRRDRSTRPDVGAGFDVSDPTGSLGGELRWGLVGWLLSAG